MSEEDNRTLRTYLDDALRYLACLEDALVFGISLEQWRQRLLDSIMRWKVRIEQVNG
jgi:hypothetical protein